MPQDDEQIGLGDIGLTIVEGAPGRLIRVGQLLNGDGYSTFEHAFVVVGVDGAVPHVVQAQPGGAALEPLRCDPSKTIYLRCPEGSRAATAAAAESYIGVGYSWLDYFALAAHRIHLPAPLLRRYIASTGHMICSQLADRAAADAGWHLFDDARWEGYVTPGALRELCYTRPWYPDPRGVRRR